MDEEGAQKIVMQLEQLRNHQREQWERQTEAVAAQRQRQYER